MLTRNTFLFLVLAGLLLPLPADAAVHRVGHGEGYDFPTLTEGMAAADPGDTIFLGDGNYSVASGEVFPIVLKPSLLILPENNEAKPHILGDGNHTVLLAENLPAQPITLDGLWVSGGGGYRDQSSERRFGGGMCFLDSIVTLRNCQIGSNRAYYGGGIYSQGGSLFMTNCRVEHNTSSGLYFNGLSPFQIGLTNCLFLRNDGYGVFGTGGTGQLSDFISFGAVIEQCTFAENQGGLFLTANGGGVADYHLDNCVIRDNLTNRAGGLGFATYGNKYSYAYLIAWVSNSLIWGNAALTTGGGVDVSSGYGDCTVALSHSAITGNVAGNVGGGIHASGLNGYYTLSHSYISLENTIVWGNGRDGISTLGVEEYQIPGDLTSDYCDIQDGVSGPGNFSLDPLFVNPAGGDFHLQSGSPCIDRGGSYSLTPHDFDGQARPNPSTNLPDVGPDEFYAGQAPTPTPAPWPTVLRTPMPSPTASLTPTASPSPTPTETPTPTWTPGQTEIYLAGYWDTALRSGAASNLTLAGYAPAAARVRIFTDGYSYAFPINLDSDSGWFMSTWLATPVGDPAGRLLLKMESWNPTSISTTWPYLTVK